MRLMDRDLVILREINRWRFCLGRHIRFLVGFSGERACDRRLKILCEAGYILKKKVLYGVPSLYTLTRKGRVILSTSLKADKIRLETLTHDITVLDAVIFIIDKYKLSLDDIKTEKELHSEDGFGTRKHVPDFVFKYNDKNVCVEVELTGKAKDKFLKNLKNNYLKYDNQIWVIPIKETRNRSMIEKSGYTDIKIIDCEVIKNYIKSGK